MRKVTRYSEQYAFPEWKYEKGSILEQMGIIQLENINHNRLFEVLPSVTYLRQKERRDEEMRLSSDKVNVGVSGKVGITSGLTLDMAVNPDFSHIESDAGVVDLNLRVSPYFEEKRPFFQEGQEHFAIAGSGHGGPLDRLLNTRRIVDPVMGLKLSGKLGKSSTINSLFTIDEFPGSIPGSDRENDYFGIFRYKHLLTGDNYVGAVYSAKEYKQGYNRVGGLDSRIRFGGNFTLETSLLHTFSKGTWLTADSNVNPENRKTIDGSSFASRLLFENHSFFIDVNYFSISKNAELSFGRLVRNGISRGGILVERRLSLESGFLKQISLIYDGNLTRDTIYRMNEHHHRFGTLFQFSASTNLELSYNTGNEVVGGQTFSQSGFSLSGESRVNNNLFFKLEYENGNAPHYTKLLDGKLETLYLQAIFQAGLKFSSEFSFSRHIYHEKYSNDKIYDVAIYRNKTTFQLNKHLSIRGIVEYNDYFKCLLTDCLLEFTYIPGTVLHLGYSPVFGKELIGSGINPRYGSFRETRSTWFFKASYLFRF